MSEPQYDHEVEYDEYGAFCCMEHAEDETRRRATPHVHEYRCSCGESCPHVAALEQTIGYLRRIPASTPGRDAQIARLRAALDGEQNARGGG